MAHYKWSAVKLRHWKALSGPGGTGLQGAAASLSAQLGPARPGMQLKARPGAAVRPWENAVATTIR